MASMAATATATATAITTTTTPTTATRLELEQHQRPLRGISIIIESESTAAATAAAAAAAAAAVATTALPASQGNSSSSNDTEMSLKSQAMLLAFGDNKSSSSNSNNNNNNMPERHVAETKQPPHVGVSINVDHASSKADFETSYNTTTTTTTTTKTYPQLLLRIGQASDAMSTGEIVATATATAAAATTIISCNNDDAAAAAAVTAVDDEVEKSVRQTLNELNVAHHAVRNVLEAGEIAGAEAAAGDAVALTAAAAAAGAQFAGSAQQASAVTETVGDDPPKEAQQTHTVKIQIANNSSSKTSNSEQQHRQPPKLGKQISVVKLNDSSSSSSCNSTENCNMVLQQSTSRVTVNVPPSATDSTTPNNNSSSSSSNSNSNSNTGSSSEPTTPYQLCYLVSSGQYSPCETLDSGTGSDLESNKSPTCDDSSHNSSSGSNMPAKLELHLKTTKIRVNNSSGGSAALPLPLPLPLHTRAYSLTDSEECDESSSSLSCDSLHSSASGAAVPHHKLHSRMLGALLPDSLLRDIRERDRDAAAYDSANSPNSSLESVSTTDAEVSYVQQQNQVNQLHAATKINGRPLKYEADQYYSFHVTEHANFRSFGAAESTPLSSLDCEAHSLPQQCATVAAAATDTDAFAGYKDVRCCSQPSTIRSAKGTVRGVKNRVRNGVATFLQLQQPNVKSFKEKDVGKVVLYTTSMGVIRDTYAKCANVKQILCTLLIKYEERDIFMSVEYQQELKERMHDERIRVPQLFVEGQHVGDAEHVERLNESGELRQLLKPYKSIAPAHTCHTCGGFSLLLCPSCNGSKKSVHRNHFTAEFVALKCMNCDDVGLVKCPNC